MVNFSSLEVDGWFVDPLKLKNYFGEEYNETISNDKLKSYLLDVDIRDFGANALNDHLDKKLNEFKGLLILQLTNWRNISYPKISNHSENNGVCKLVLSDGFISVSALQIDTPLNIE